MKPRGRVWKAFKWSGAVATVLLLVIWVASGRYVVQLTWYPPAFAYCLFGKLFINWDSSTSNAPYVEFLQVERFPGDTTYYWWFSYKKRGDWTLGIPIWFLASLTTVPTALMFRSDRRRRRFEAQTLCAKCGYSKIGLPAKHTCPECGTAT